MSNAPAFILLGPEVLTQHFGQDVKYQSEIVKHVIVAFKTLTLWQEQVDETLHDVLGSNIIAPIKFNFRKTAEHISIYISVFKLFC